MRGSEITGKKADGPSSQRTERTGASPGTAGQQAASRSNGESAYWERLQSSVGNQAVLQMMASSPNGALIQRMKDKDGSQREMLEEMYRGIYENVNRNSGGLKPLPKPSDRTIKGLIERAIEGASDLDDALDILADSLIVKYFGVYSKEGQNTWRKQITDEGKQARKAAAAYEKEKKRDLAALNDGKDKDSTSEKKNARKRVKVEWDGAEDFYADKSNLKLIRKRLQDKKFRNVVMTSSSLAQRRLMTMARPTVATRAKHNKLQEETQPLGMADMLAAQQNYTKASSGKSLLLEKGSDYQVTMTRKGGQEIGQLGPYLTRSGSKPSVKQTVKGLIGPNLSTQELARATETRDPKRIAKKHKMTGKLLRNVRSLRHLHAVERDRGPEVAISTAMEGRMASLSMTHMADYVGNHPLAPPNATTDLRSAREKAGKKGPGEYVPSHIQQRAFDTLDRLAVESFKKPPVEDPSVSLLLRELAYAPEENKSADEEQEEDNGLTNAMTLGMMSPQYTWPEDREHELEPEYMKLFGELTKKPGLGKIEEERDEEDEFGWEDERGFADDYEDEFDESDKELPVKGLPNRENDCFINAVLQLMAEPYADYFDVSKHALKNQGKRTVQTLVGEAMKRIGGEKPEDEEMIGKLREKLLGLNLVEGMDGQEDASELMLGLLRVVTDLEGTVLTLPVFPLQYETVQKDETLRDVAERTGCDLKGLEGLNTLLDTSPIVQVTRSTKTITKATLAPVPGDSSVFTGGQSTGGPERGPGFETIDMDTFATFDEYLECTFGQGAIRTALSEDNRLSAINDGTQLKVYEYTEQRRMVRAPDVMTFSLKRFKRTEKGLAKDGKDFPMPDSFKLVEHSGGAGKEKTYALTGAVRHSGGIGGGHYTADVSRGDQWYHANDEHVGEQLGLDDSLSAEGYIYTYKVTETNDL